MSTKTKTTAAAAIAALALPSAAFAHDGDGKRKGHDKGADHPSVKHRSDDRSRERTNKGKHKGWAKHRRAVVLFGVDAEDLTISDGKLAAPVSLDPIAANRKARKLFSLDRAKIAGEDEITVGTAGDEVKVKYLGLQATDALQSTDVVKVLGRVKDGELDIVKIYVKRRAAQTNAG